LPPRPQTTLYSAIRNRVRYSTFAGPKLGKLALPVLDSDSLPAAEKLPTLRVGEIPTPRVVDWPLV
jgi:hypothetical protein